MVGASHSTDDVAVRLSVPLIGVPGIHCLGHPIRSRTTATVKAVCVRTSCGAACAAAAPNRRNNPYFCWGGNHTPRRNSPQTAFYW